MPSHFLIHRFTFAPLCLSAALLLACEPYKQCDESLKVGDKLTFKLTEGLSLEEQVEECGGELPFGVDTVFHLTVEDFGGGDYCDSASGPVNMDDVELEWLSPAASNGSPAFRGRYQLDQPDQCIFFLKLDFYEGSLVYQLASSVDNTCPPRACHGDLDGELFELE
jgi:hypothetical protein